MRLIRRLTVAVMIMALSICTSARAQVLELVPSESMALVKIKNIQDVNAKIAALSQQWGLANMRPELNDLLGTLLTMTNLGPGLNKTGDAAMAILKPAAGENEPGILMLVSVTDYKAFAAALPNSKPDGDLTTFSMGGNPKPGFVADWGKYAAISPSKDLISKKGGGLKVSAASAKELDTKDLIIYANMKEISKEALPHFQQMKPQMMAMFEQGIMNMPGADPKYAPAMKAYIGQLLVVVEGFLRDCDGASFGATLSKDGISTTFMADFKPDSYAGKMFKDMKNTDASFTAGLPDAKYFFYGGGVSDKAGVEMFNDFIAPIEKEIAAMGDEGKAISGMIAGLKSVMSSTKSANFGMVAPNAGALGKEGFFQTVKVTTGDSAKLMAAQKSAMASVDDLVKKIDARIGGLGLKVTYTPGAKTVEGVSLDQATLTFDGQPQSPEGQQLQMMLKMILGPNGMSAYGGAVSPDKSIEVTGNDELVAAAVKAAKNNEDTLGKGPATKVNAALPQNRLAAYYLQIDNIAATVMDVMAAKGLRVGVKLPPNLPPLAAVVNTDGSAIRIDGYIPAQTVQSLITVGLQIFMQNMNGGGQPGGL